MQEKQVTASNKYSGQNSNKNGKFRQEKEQKNQPWICTTEDLHPQYSKNFKNQ